MKLKTMQRVYSSTANTLSKTSVAGLTAGRRVLRSVQPDDEQRVHTTITVKAPVVVGKKRRYKAPHPTVRRLPETKAPGGSKWLNSMAICTIIRDEHAADMVEFLQYYRYDRCSASVFKIK